MYRHNHMPFLEMLAAIGDDEEAQQLAGGSGLQQQQQSAADAAARAAAQELAMPKMARDHQDQMMQLVRELEHEQRDTELKYQKEH